MLSQWSPTRVPPSTVAVSMGRSLRPLVCRGCGDPAVTSRHQAHATEAPSPIENEGPGSVRCPCGWEWLSSAPSMTYNSSFGLLTVDGGCAGGPRHLLRLRLDRHRRARPIVSTSDRPGDASPVLAAPSQREAAAGTGMRTELPLIPSRRDRRAGLTEPDRSIGGVALTPG